MDYIPFHPPRIGLRVSYQGEGPPAAGFYTVVENDEYDMAEHVVVADSEGRLFGLNARLLEVAEQKD